MIGEARESLPELPAQRAERYEGEGLPRDAAVLLAADPVFGDYFEAVAAAGEELEKRVVANWVTGELVGALRAAGADADGPPADRVSAAGLAKLIGLVQARTISHGAGRTVLATMVAEGGDPEELVESQGLAQISDSSELEGIVESAIDANPDAAERIRAGNPKAIGAIVGAVMRETKGRADGGEVNRLIREKLGA
jgi:aspartyl-tRNA(Asn)/glutamyl-tRNA(Gln) amidotransferase subunit B